MLQAAVSWHLCLRARNRYGSAALWRDIMEGLKEWIPLCDKWSVYPDVLQSVTPESFSSLLLFAVKQQNGTLHSQLDILIQTLLHCGIMVYLNWRHWTESVYYLWWKGFIFNVRFPAVIVLDFLFLLCVLCICQVVYGVWLSIDSGQRGSVLSWRTVNNALRSFSASVWETS